METNPTAEQCLHLFQQGHFEAALEIARRLLNVNNKNAMLLNIAGCSAKAAGCENEAIAYWQDALRVEPGFADVWYNLGLLYAEKGRLSEAEAAYQSALNSNPSHIEAWKSIAVAAFMQARLQDAVSYSQTALELAPLDPESHYNHGLYLAAQQRRSEAKSAYREALRLCSSHAKAWNNLAIELYKERNYAEAAGAARQAIACTPEMAEAWNNLGATSMALGSFSEAEIAFTRALQLKEDYADAASSLGNALRMQHRYSEAEQAYRRALSICPALPQALSQLVRVKRYAVAWQDLEKDDKAAMTWLNKAQPGALSPFALLVLPQLSAIQQRSAGLLWAQHEFSVELTQPPLVARDHDYRHKTPRIGYLSADMYEHATMYLLAGVLEAHDPQQVELYIYSYGPDKQDAARKRAEASCSKFRVLSEMDDETAAKTIAADEIDILVDLKGYTQDCRLGITARRPAPIIASWLGYPGSLGHERLADYIIGDPVVTPLHEADNYSETLALLPHSYQPNDGKRVIGPRPTRSEAGLPETGFVFCSFNQTAKLEPFVFGIWCRLLDAVPNSVLWLLAPTAEAKVNLRREAETRGITPERVVFAEKMAHSAHLGRLQLADLALDTFPYGSHTTGSDALWAGVPLITMPGQTFASRVAASLLQAAGLPELITKDWDEYFALASTLALDLNRLGHLRAKLQNNRLKAPLFNTLRFTRNLEALFVRMWQDHQQRKRVPIQISDSVMMTEMKDDLAVLLSIARRTRILDVGTNTNDGVPSYRPLIEASLCEVVGLEPQQDALEELRKTAGQHETYLPYLVGDGEAHTLHECVAPGMTSLFEPDAKTQEIFAEYKRLAAVTAKTPVQTIRLDDLAELQNPDLLKIDLKGGELQAIRNGSNKLRDAVVIQTGISFVALYRDQPTFGEIDIELRTQGFIPHCFLSIKKWPIAPCVVNNNPRTALNQLLNADLVYIRDITKPEAITSEQLKQLALIAHHCFGSYDLALRCVMLLEERGELATGSQAAYLELVSRKHSSTTKSDTNAKQQAKDFHKEGLVRLQAGNRDAAIDCLRNAVALDPTVAAYHVNLAVALKGKDAHEAERIALYQKALELDGEDPITHANLAAVLTDAGDFIAAEAAARRALELAPGRVDALMNLGGALAGQKRYLETATAYDEAGPIEPALLAAGKAYRAAGNMTEALTRFRQAKAKLLQQPPSESAGQLANVCQLIGEVLGSCFDHAGAEQQYREVLRYKPDDMVAMTDLGNELHVQGKLEEAEACYRTVANANPDSAGAHVNLGIVYHTRGNYEAALVEFRRALSIEPQNLTIYSNIGASLTYSPSYSPADLKQVYDQFDALVAQPLRDPRPHLNDRNPDRPLRVGYVSPDFRKHVVAYFALPLLEGHQQDKVEVYCYYNHRQQDDWTERFRTLATKWLDCVNMTHQELADRIRDDQVDILVDLAGHTQDNRLRVFARKPAPIQVTWMGYVTTTGLSAIDYRFTHNDADPIGVDHDYSEVLERLSSSIWCYRPLQGMPEVSPPPFKAKGYITFGSFNRFSKVSPVVLDCWASILLGVPKSRLILCIPEGAVRDEVCRRFAEAGIQSERLKFFSKVPHEQFWSLHGDVDIALDPFPFNGGTTTCETLWLGVPLVTCKGGPHSFPPRFASRMGYALLSAVGLPELAAETEQDYVKIAISLAQDSERLAALRAGLRTRMSDSALCDEPRFVADVEAAYRRMWKAWCASQ